MVTSMQASYLSAKQWPHLFHTYSCTKFRVVIKIGHYYERDELIRRTAFHANIKLTFRGLGMHIMTFIEMFAGRHTCMYIFANSQKFQ